jgi:hypothetical protein
MYAVRAEKRGYALYDTTAFPVIAAVHTDDG